jgi:hypothetical protein
MIRRARKLWREFKETPFRDGNGLTPLSLAADKSIVVGLRSLIPTDRSETLPALMPSDLPCPTSRDGQRLMKQKTRFQETHSIHGFRISTLMRSAQRDAGNSYSV